MSSKDDFKSFKTLVQQARLRLLKMHFEARIGHIGGNLSCIDLLMSLYHQIMATEDEFVLSKGHAVGSLYVVLASIGKISDEELRTFHGEGTSLPGHPPRAGLYKMPFATGSLGHGLPLAN